MGAFYPSDQYREKQHVEKQRRSRMRQSDAALSTLSGKQLAEIGEAAFRGYTVRPSSYPASDGSSDYVVYQHCHIYVGDAATRAAGWELAIEHMSRLPLLESETDV